MCVVMGSGGGLSNLHLHFALRRKVFRQGDVFETDVALIIICPILLVTTKVKLTEKITTCVIFGEFVENNLCDTHFLLLKFIKSGLNTRKSILVDLNRLGN